MEKIENFNKRLTLFSGFTLSFSLSPSLFLSFSDFWKVCNRTMIEKKNKRSREKSNMDRNETSQKKNSEKLAYFLFIENKTISNKFGFDRFIFYRQFSKSFFYVYLFFVFFSRCSPSLSLSLLFHHRSWLETNQIRLPKIETV